MNHLLSSFTGRNNFWRYIVMLVIVFLAINIIGGLPFLIASAVRAAADPEALSRLASNPSDISVLGFSKNLALFLMLFPFLIGLIAFIAFVKPLHGRTYLQTMTGASSYRWGRLLIAALIWTLLSAAYLFLCRWLDPGSYRSLNSSATMFWLIAISVALIPFQAALEETLFRGYLMQAFTLMGSRLKITGGVLFPLLLTSLLFGLLHSWNPEIKAYGFLTMIPQYVFFGLLLGITTVIDDGTEIAVGLHAANNIFLSIMLTNSASTLQTPAVYEQLKIYPWADFLGLLVSGILFILLMKLIFGWKDLSVLLRSPKPEAAADQTA